MGPVDAQNGRLGSIGNRLAAPDAQTRPVQSGARDIYIMHADLIVCGSSFFAETGAHFRGLL